MDLGNGRTFQPEPSSIVAVQQNGDKCDLSHFRRYWPAKRTRRCFVVNARAAASPLSATQTPHANDANAFRTLRTTKFP
jgi:hypothetical protein